MVVKLLLGSDSWYKSCGIPFLSSQLVDKDKMRLSRWHSLVGITALTFFHSMTLLAWQTEGQPAFKKAAAIIPNGSIWVGSSAQHEELQNIKPFKSTTVTSSSLVQVYNYFNSTFTWDLSTYHFSEPASVCLFTRRCHCSCVWLMMSNANFYIHQMSSKSMLMSTQYYKITVRTSN